MTDEILTERRGSIGLVTLNRPKALNALTLPMIRALDPVLARWDADREVAAVVMLGAGDRAFCAGGDVRAVWEDGMAARRGQGDGSLTRDFFREEYRLNHRIHRLPKPQVALLNGITMGGGVGLSVHGRFRVVTEKTVFAMPETGIGLFPDVGAAWFLTRCPGEIGTYLALTGARLHAADCLAVGFGTHHVPSEVLDALVAELEALDGTADATTAVDRILTAHVTPAGEASLMAHRSAIDRCFAHDRVEYILAALRREATDWARETLATLERMSPTSLKVTLAQLRRISGRSIEDCLAMDYRLSQVCMAGHDFYEGIRALLVDKDRTPRWQPASLAEVTEDLVERYFAPLGERELSLD